MIKRKNIKEHGKLRLSRYFQEFERIQGRNGIVIGKKGSAYIIKIKEGGLEKDHIIAPIHLIKIK